MQVRTKGLKRSRVHQKITIDGETTLQMIQAKHLQASNISTAVLGKNCQANIVANLPACINAIKLTKDTPNNVLPFIPEHISLAIVQANFRIGKLYSLASKNMRIVSLNGYSITISAPNDDILKLINAAEDELQELEEHAELIPPTKKQRLDAPVTSYAPTLFNNSQPVSSVPLPPHVAAILNFPEAPPSTLTPLSFYIFNPVAAPDAAQEVPVHSSTHSH